MPMMRKIFSCRHARDCSHYNPDCFTCNTPNAEHGFCGYYRKLEAAERKGQKNSGKAMTKGLAEV